MQKWIKNHFEGRQCRDVDWLQCMSNGIRLEWREEPIGVWVMKWDLSEESKWIMHDTWVKRAERVMYERSRDILVKDWWLNEMLRFEWKIEIWIED